MVWLTVLQVKCPKLNNLSQSSFKDSSQPIHSIQVEFHRPTLRATSNHTLQLLILNQEPLINNLGILRCLRCPVIQLPLAIQQLPAILKLSLLTLNTRHQPPVTNNTQLDNILRLEHTQHKSQATRSLQLTVNLRCHLVTHTHQASTLPATDEIISMYYF